MSKKFASKTAVAAIMAGIMSFSPVIPAFSQVSTALAAEADYSSATTINVSGLVEGKYDGYKVEAAEILDEDGNAVSDYAGTTVTIQEAGTYRITGTADNVNIAVKKGVTGVTLVLDDLTLSCDYTAPIVCKKTSEVNIVLVGTNTLTDNESMSNDGVLADYEGACIKAKDGSTLTISGTGTLNIEGNCKNGIRATCNPGEDGETGAVSLSILSGTYNISVQDDNSDSDTAADGDAIHSDDVLAIGSENMSDSALTINVNKACEGLEGGKVTIWGGSINVTSSDDGINAANADYAKAGITYAFDITINGGAVTVNAGGDGLDSNGNITTAGGTIVVSSSSGGNGAVDSGDGNYGWTNSGATVVLFGQGSMEETPVSGGYVAWGAGMGGGMMGGGGRGGRGQWGDQTGQTTTDGTTAADGTQTGQQGQFGGRGGRGQMPADGTRPELPADGTMPQMPADGSMPEMPADGTMPTDGGFGGGMMGGGQSATSVTYSKGQTITLTDASGNVVWSGEAPVSGRSFIYSAAGLTEGATYTLNVAGTDAGTATAAAGTGSNGGGFNGGGQQGQPTDGGQSQPADGGQTQPAEDEQQDQVADPKAETWVYENDTWYVRYADGTLKTGWACLNGNWYYLDADKGGAMKAGWTYADGLWYYMNEAHDGTYGKMLTGWVFNGGKWYYLNEKSDGTKGAMLRNTTVDGYKLGADGAWIA